MSQCLIFNQQALIIVTDDGTNGSPLDQAIFTFSNYSGCINKITQISGLTQRNQVLTVNHCFNT